MTKREIIELYLADLNNLVPDSDAKRSRVIDLEDELEALRIHDVSKSVEPVREVLLPFDFIVWYSGMEKEKIERAYQRYLREEKRQ